MGAAAVPAESVAGEPLPYASRPIDYFSKEIDHPVSRIVNADGTPTAPLSARGKSGYLVDLLSSLKIPPESQLLVYSKTSVNVKLVSPRKPRAIYFNDDTYVAWIPESSSVEITAIDPRKGAVFLTLNQAPAPAQFQRQESCLACHVGKGTQGIPGLLMKSVTADTSGNPVTSIRDVDRMTPWKDLAGGWYLSGVPRGFDHAGIMLDATRNDVLEQDYYPLRGSDVVAFAVLKHQLEVQNLLIRLRYEHVLGKPMDSMQPLLKSLFFQADPGLPAPLSSSPFAKKFSERGMKARTGGSLRTLNLETRLFEHRLSYLIDSRIVKAYPPELRRILYGRVAAGVTDKAPEIAGHLSPEERQKIEQILRETQPEIFAATP
ncbi:MAG: hypothetical protein U0903_07995 [Planctomycetales bacterium]